MSSLFQTGNHVIDVSRLITHVQYSRTVCITIIKTGRLRWFGHGNLKMTLTIADSLGKPAPER